MSPQSKSPVHNQVSARNESGTIRSEKQCRLADVSRHSPASQRMKRSRLLGQRLRVIGIAQILFPKARVNISRTNAVDANTTARQLQGQISRQCDHASL